MNIIEEQHQTKYSQIKQKAFEHFDKPTLRGFSRIFSSKHIISRIFWLLVSSVSLLYCSYLVAISILNFDKHEVVTRYENIYENQPLFPLVAFCDHIKNKTECTMNKQKCPEFEQQLANDDSCVFFNQNEENSIFRSEMVNPGLTTI